MISTGEASKYILDAVRNIAATEKVSLHEAHNRILARDIYTPTAHPLFNQSAVDGYALATSDINQHNHQAFQVADEIQAGDTRQIQIESGKSIRIFTGAPVPEGADAVIMQEHVTIEEQHIYIDPERAKKGANIRKQGEQLRSGELALEAGTRLSAAGIGFLASLGIQEAEVSKQPSVGIVVTGNEFHKGPGMPERGKIFESNGIMLRTALASKGISAGYEVAADDLSTMQETVKRQSENNDITLVTGGVSVGDYDFTREAIERAGFEILFHKVNQKPGKPLLSAQKGNKFIFGLPGNPRSVLICYYMYVLPLINKLLGKTAPQLPEVVLPLGESFQKKDHKTHFTTVTISGNKVHLKQEGSHMLKSFSEARGIAVLPEEKEWFPAGEHVKVYLLPI